MKELIEDYKRRLKTVEDFLSNFNSNGSVNDIRKDERLKTKAAEYRTFIAEMERELRNNSENNAHIENVKELTTKLIKANYVRLKNQDFDDGIGGTVKVYGVETDDLRCKIWNSSNNGHFDLVAACANVAEQLVVDNEVAEGRFSIGFNEIMFEIIER